MLSALIIGLLAAVIAATWALLDQWQLGLDPQAFFANFADAVGSTALVTMLLLAGNLIALFAAVGIFASRVPARLPRALIYTGLGIAVEFVLLLLVSMDEYSDFDPSAPFVFHVLVAISLVAALVRKTPLPKRALMRRSAIVAATWVALAAIVAVLTFPFIQYGSATSATEAANLRQLRQISNRLLAAAAPEIKNSPTPKLNAISSNQASIVDFENFDCAFGTVPTHFDASFGAKATLKSPAPQLVLKEEYDPRSSKFSPGKTTLNTEEDQFTAASLAASKVYWDGVKARISQRLGALPAGWNAEYGANNGFIVTLKNTRSDAYVITSLRSGYDGKATSFFSAQGSECYPLDKAPTGTR